MPVYCAPYALLFAVTVQIIPVVILNNLCLYDIGQFLAGRHGNVSVLTKFKGQAMLNHAVRDIMEHKETSLGK